MAELFFSTTGKSPGAWLLAGVRLKKAADRIDVHKVIEPALLNDVSSGKADPEESGFLELIQLRGIRLMLLGLAFELLLKGLYILQKGNPPERLDHNLHELAKEIEQDKFRMTARELDLLANLEIYIHWQGRYPMPKKASHYKVTLGMWDDETVAEAFWTRLKEHLLDNGYMLKIDGSRLPLRTGPGRADPEQ